MVWLVISLLPAQPVRAETVLRICGDAAGWPPYTFESDGAVRGYDVDVLALILPAAGFDYEIHMLPWKRCLLEVEKGLYQIALSASASAERQKNFLTSKPYYQVQPGYAYSRKRFSSAPPISSSNDLKNYLLCGLRGYDYSRFGIENRWVMREANHYAQALAQIRRGRCDLFLTRLEILHSLYRQGDVDLGDDIQVEALPGVAADDFVMLISRLYSRAPQLKIVLDEGISRLRKEGRLQELLEFYLSQP
ncbi:substrate-binding periplasmic protein [Thalassolituus hydrocarboniclasticus]|uniref:Transporter substrate-binding domain-containing protein n=1 Tax=Thalassolituus hydrocarboniclasticus TaxID=2742796 RepID=A0ABY6AF73_9GAMM|nr:transporter substrate-binding domain-containing protein [Thalassolituus hydrocarboniclasticus]UXD89193.1 transporter substrate-binding domain-containing protein [Thalassolituus hydrocarboniclasticus]